MKAFISWSGGKETSLSCYRAIKAKEIEVAYLLNMISEDGKYSRSHGVGSHLMRSQAKAIGIPLIQVKTSWQDYEENFKKAISNFKKKRIEAGIFGDVDLQEHRDWIERVCNELEIRPILPLWKEEREKLLQEFIQAGFKAVVVALSANSLGREWLGRKIDKEFIETLKIRNNFDLCGERGEYHTFVLDGPLFKKKIKFLKTKKVKKDNHWFLNISQYYLEDKI